MKFTLPENAFPPVNLSKERIAAIIHEAETVVRETIVANEAFLKKGGIFTESKWKLVREKEGLSVYRQRRPATNSLRISEALRETAFFPVSQRKSWSTEPPSSRVRTETKDQVEIATEEEISLSSSSTLGIQETKRRPNVSLLVMHGTVDGSLDDYMFGTFAATDQAWMWKSSHINDRLNDSRILVTMQKPTKEDPFRFLGIKWFAKEQPAVLSGIFQQRDFLIVEATGLTRDSKGETVGYHLMHSITLPDIIPELSGMGIVRGDVSFCFINRQSGPGTVEMFCSGYSDFRGDMMDRISVAFTSDGLLCAGAVVDYANIKKLTWLMQHKDGKARQSRRVGGAPHSTQCEYCYKRLPKFSLIGSGQGSACQICHLVVCLKCSVAKKMTVDVSSTGSVKQCTLRFCLSCLLEAKEQSVWKMALSNVESPSECSSDSGSTQT